MISGVPHIIRSDRGTENGVIEMIQVALRFNHGDDHSAYNRFLYGKSTRNQVSECVLTHKTTNEVDVLSADTLSHIYCT